MTVSLTRATDVTGGPCNIRAPLCTHVTRIPTTSIADHGAHRQAAFRDARLDGVDVVLGAARGNRVLPANSRDDRRAARASINGMPPCGSTSGSAIVDALSPIAGSGRSRPIIPSTTLPTVVTRHLNSSIARERFRNGAPLADDRHAGPCLGSRMLVRRLSRVVGQGSPRKRPSRRSQSAARSLDGEPLRSSFRASWRPPRRRRRYTTSLADWSPGAWLSPRE